MDIFDEFIEMVVNFVRKYVVKFVVNKVLDWLWKKIKPKLLKVGRKMKLKLKDKLYKIRNKWLNFRQRKRVNVHETLTLIQNSMNEHQINDHSYNVLIMIIDTKNQMTIIVVISLK